MIEKKHNAKGCSVVMQPRKPYLPHGIHSSKNEDGFYRFTQNGDRIEIGAPGL